jgi:predicted kinase
MKGFILIIDGPMGSGKSTIGALVYKKLKRTALLSTDKIKWFVSNFDRSKEDNRMIAMVLRSMATEFVSQGINLLLPQAFWKKENVLPYLKLAKKNKFQLFVYHLEAPKDILLKRIAKRIKPKEAKTPISKARILANLKMWKENKYEMGEHFDTSRVSAEYVAKKILEDVTK